MIGYVLAGMATVVVFFLIIGQLGEYDRRKNK